MKLSFVIPAYNEEQYLADCLKSVIADIATAGADAEIIVVNNASTDRTKAVALSFPGVIVVDESRKGLVRARQAGFTAANGDIIANIDADGRLPLGWTAQVLGEFSKQPNLVGLSGPYIFYDASPALKTLVKTYYYFAYILYLVNKHILRVSSLMQGGNFVVKRSVLIAINGFNTDLEFYGEDTDIARRLHQVGNVKFTLRLRAYSSARRLKAEGIVTTGWHYLINYIWIILFKKPFSQEYSDIRPKD